MKRFFPGFINPEKNELFSSWLTRVSFEHRTKSYSFSKSYFNGQSIWNRDIDKMFPVEIVSSMLSYSNLRFCDIFKMFLISYRDIVFNDSKLNSYTVGLLNLGINHRKRKGYGLLCCPGCLSKEIVYYKKEWRLFFSISCIECMCELIDCCPNCKSPIAFHRLEIGYKEKILNYPLYICWNCQFDLRKAKIDLKRNSIDLKYQKHINQTIIKGFNNVANYSFSFLYVMQLITNQLLTSSKKWNRVKLAVENYYSINFKSKGKVHSRLVERKDALIYAYLILYNWPENFFKIFKNTNVRYSDFSKDSKILPFWFERVVKYLD